MFFRGCACWMLPRNFRRFRAVLMVFACGFICRAQRLSKNSPQNVVVVSRISKFFFSRLLKPRGRVSNLDRENREEYRCGGRALLEALLSGVELLLSGALHTDWATPAPKFDQNPTEVQQGCFANLKHCMHCTIIAHYFSSQFACCFVFRERQKMLYYRVKLLRFGKVPYSTTHVMSRLIYNSVHFWQLFLFDVPCLPPASIRRPPANLNSKSAIRVTCVFNKTK